MSLQHINFKAITCAVCTLAGAAVVSGHVYADSGQGQIQYRGQAVAGIPIACRLGHDLEHPVAQPIAELGHLNHGAVIQPS